MGISYAIKWFRAICLRGVCSWPLWISQACLPAIDVYTPIKITVQDSTGKPLPDFNLKVVGMGSGGGGFGGKGPPIIEELTLSTDSSGTVEKELHWHDKISHYQFGDTFQSPTYARYFIDHPCGAPLNPSCELEYISLLPRTTTTIVIQVKFYK